MISPLSNKNSPHISVIIVTYNNADEIVRCLESLPQNTAKCRLQIIIIDNASTDGTQSKLRAFQQSQLFDFELHIVLNTVNKGFTAAINQGIALASAPYILFLNPDTVVPQNALSTLVVCCQYDDRIGVVAPQLRNADGSVQASCRRFPRHRDVFFNVFGLAILFRKSRYFDGWKMGDFDHTQKCFVDQPQGAFLLSKREVIEKVGLLDEGFKMFFSDVDWCRRVVQAGYKILFTPEVHVIHHKGKSIIPNRPEMIHSSHRSFIRYFWKHYRAWVWWIPNVLVSILLVFSGFFRYFCAKLKTVNLEKKYP
ncbi:MAG: glycosyltransferase family 2 protein [bacterium]